MNIVKKRNRTTYRELDIGDVFLFDNDYYMKTQNNSIRLCDGVGCFVGDCKTVDKMKAIIYVEDYINN